MVYQFEMWFQKNLKYILQEDAFPLEIQGDSAEELSRIIYESEFNDEIYELIQDWIFRHSWFSAREGSYLADIFFNE